MPIVREEFRQARRHAEPIAHEKGNAVTFLRIASGIAALVLLNVTLHYVIGFTNKDGPFEVTLIRANLMILCLAAGALFASVAVGVWIR